MVIEYQKLACKLMAELTNKHPECVITDENETPDSIAGCLHKYLDTEAVVEFSSSAVGRGILLGFISACFLFEQMDAISFDDEDGDENAGH